MMANRQLRLIDLIDDMSEGKDVLFQSVRNVEDVMSYDVKTLTLEDDIETCLKIMKENKIRHVPVVDAAKGKKGKQRFAGIVSQRDVFRQISPYLGKVGELDTDFQALRQPLEKIVTIDAKCASPGTPIQEATTLMVDNRVDSVPVLLNGELVGIVTATDVLRLFVRLHAIGQLSREKTKTEERSRFIDLLAGNSDEAVHALSSVLRTVKDIMTEQVVSLEEQDNLSEVMQVMQRGRFRHVPVVDKEKRLVGIISDRDVLRLLPFRHGQRRPQTKVFRSELFDVDSNEPVIRKAINHFMNQEIIHANPNCGFHDAVKMLHEMRISCLPVTDEDKKLFGIATVTDVMRGLLAAYALFEKTRV
jgi:acetoin utilization protein AcuB